MNIVTSSKCRPTHSPTCTCNPHHFAAFSLASQLEENQGILDLSCDFTSAIWPPPAGYTTTSSTTTSTSSPDTPSSRSSPGVTPHVPVTPGATPVGGELGESGEDSKENEPSFCEYIFGIRFKVKCISQGHSNQMCIEKYTLYFFKCCSYCKIYANRKNSIYS